MSTSAGHQTLPDTDPQTNSSAAHHAPGAGSETRESHGTAGYTEQSRIPTTDLLRRHMGNCGEYTFQALNKIGKLSPGVWGQGSHDSKEEYGCHESHDW